MELGSLFDLIHNKSVVIDHDRIHRVLLQTARGMCYLHAQQPPILHRDLKSQNLLITAEWDVKLCDFGMSRTKGINVTMTKLGTLQWVARETHATGKLWWRMCPDRLHGDGGL